MTSLVAPGLPSARMNRSIACRRASLEFDQAPVAGQRLRDAPSATGLKGLHAARFAHTLLKADEQLPCAELRAGRRVDLPGLRKREIPSGGVDGNPGKRLPAHAGKPPRRRHVVDPRLGPQRRDGCLLWLSVDAGDGNCRRRDERERSSVHAASWSGRGHHIGKARSVALRVRVCLEQSYGSSRVGHTPDPPRAVDVSNRTAWWRRRRPALRYCYLSCLR